MTEQSVWQPPSVEPLEDVSRAANTVVGVGADGSFGFSSFVSLR